MDNLCAYYYYCVLLFFFFLEFQVEDELRRQLEEEKESHRRTILDLGQALGQAEAKLISKILIFSGPLSRAKITFSQLMFRKLVLFVSIFVRKVDYF